MQTVLITGCSSGFGLDTAKLFLDRGWKVAATMRRPDASVLPASPNLRVLPLDVTDAASVAAVVEAAGPVDALVNNAGIGWLSPLEATPMPTAREVFETNTLGLMAMTQAVLPQFRARRAGVVVNVTSSVTLHPLPLLSVYTASKSAVNAFTTVLALELAPFGVRALTVLPGRSPDTKFGENARKLGAGAEAEGYGELMQRVFAGWAADKSPLTKSEDVAEAVWRAVTDSAAPARIAAGADAEALSLAGF